MSVAGAEGTLDHLLKKLGRADTPYRFRLVCLLSLDGNILECSPATLERAGLTHPDVVGRPLWAAMWWAASPSSAEDVRQAVLRAAQGDFVRCDVPSQGSHNATETVLLDLTIAPVRSENATAAWLLVEARDVVSTGGEPLLTVRGTELLANDTRERYRQKIARITLDSMVQFVGLLDAEGTVLEINQVALDAVGIKLSDVEGRPFWTTFWWQVSEEINFGIRDSIRRAAEGEFVRWDTEIYGRDGGKETIVIDASLMPVKDEAGKVVFIAAEGRDITAKKAYEREIARQCEELAKLDVLKTQFFANVSQFETLLNEAPQGVYLVDEDFRICLANRTATSVFGDIPHLIGRDFGEVIHGLLPAEIAADRVRMFRHTLETGESYGEREYVSTRVDRVGKEHYEWRIHRVQLPDGRFGVVCYFRDVSDQVKVREEIERSEERFRAFVTATSDVIYQMSPDWSEMRQLQGRDFIAETSDLSHNWLDRYIHPDDHEVVLRAIAEAIRSRKVFELEHRVIRVDGSVGWTNSRAVPRLNAAGEVIEWFGTARDVSERKLQEEEIARLTAESEYQRRLYEAIVSSTPDLVYIFDRHHRFVFANDALLKMWGKTREEALGKNCLELGYEPWHAAMHDREIEEAVSTRQAVRGEVPFNGTAGRRIYDYIFVPVVSANGEVELIAGTTRDVTERKRTEEELRRVNQDLEQFAYSASHDLKEPLRTVKIYSELLVARYRHKLDGTALDFLDNVRTGADRMESLVRDVLAYTQASRVGQPSEPIDAMAALAAALANLEAAITESGGVVKADALPFVSVHATQLQSLFQNLIGNALKYRRPGIAPVVNISARRQDGFWLFCVADNGIGIEPQFREQIFGLFKRLHTSDEYSGTGIGLAICKRIVERYHGRIWVGAEGGEGCRFYFTLPG